MIITNKLTMNLKKPLWAESIDAVQDDRYCRNLEISLLDGKDAWTLPEAAAVRIRYCKSDGKGGEYDALPDGTAAWSADGNVLTIALAPQVLTVPGPVSLSVILSLGGTQLNTFAILINVHPAVHASAADSEDYFNLTGLLPAPVSGEAGQYLRIASVDRNGRVAEVEAVSVSPGGAPATYLEANGIGYQQNPAAAESDIWSRWNYRLAFGMDTADAPAPFEIGGQLLADGTIIARNNGTKDKNRWGFHVYEAYAKDNYSRMTMLLDKHECEANDKPSLELYYYTGANHHASSYGNTKIGSDVAFHSFCFDRDKLTAYGEIDSKMPITLARISLAKDLNSTYSTVADADAAYEPENQPEENTKCLKYIALKNAQNGAMFYDTDRNRPVMKVNGQWCDLPFTAITDAAYEPFNSSTVLSVAWESGVIDGNGGLVDNTARIRTSEYLPSSATSVTANDGYEFGLVCYNAAGGVTGGYAAYYIPSLQTWDSSVVYVTELDLTSIPESDYTYYKLIARRTDQRAMNTSEGANIIVR